MVLLSYDNVMKRQFLETNAVITSKIIDLLTYDIILATNIESSCVLHLVADMLS